MASASNLSVTVEVRKVTYRWFGVRLGRLFLGAAWEAPDPDLHAAASPVPPLDRPC